MKFSEIPEPVQKVAAELLAKKLDEVLIWGADNRTEKAKEIAETVRGAFEELLS